MSWRAKESVKEVYYSSTLIISYHISIFIIIYPYLIIFIISYRIISYHIISYHIRPYFKFVFTIVT